jgi:alcohol dehydrogenase (NADP+)
MVYPDTFEGYMVQSEKTWSDFKKQEASHVDSYTLLNLCLSLYAQFKPKPFEDYDIDIKIEVCGVCGSDVHTITGGWGGANFPLCVGHSMVMSLLKIKASPANKLRRLWVTSSKLARKSLQ